MRTVLLGIAISLLSVSPVRAELAAQPVDTVVGESELIVVAKVMAVSGKEDDKAYATAQVLEIWKGGPLDYVEFLAEPTWACDITEAHVGETVVLFLIRGEPSRSYLIDNSGGGRLPIQVVDNVSFATSHGHPVLPDWIPTTPGLAVDEFSRLVRLDVLRELVAVSSRTLSNKLREGFEIASKDQQGAMEDLVAIKTVVLEAMLHRDSAIEEIRWLSPQRAMVHCQRIGVGRWLYIVEKEHDKWTIGWNGAF